ncbi:sugar phosphate isomerase/epimerase family protein [Defluviitalea phaphyphila]|uniref:sugar phosphate isomerase/epimerase family protein n=1 Tax=Defluviitalea phaphyphila TaxID=1473580 RepID=UPI000730C6AC|nr:sugar phosphate isomerase/epimerase family protein [Defluviitalea phaphyphila]
MKLAFSTLGCPTWSWDKIVSEAEKNGYDGIEIRGIKEEMYLPKAKILLKANHQKLLSDLTERNLSITNLGSGASFHDSKKYEASIKEGKEYIDLAYDLKIPYVRIFGDKIPEPDKKQETIELISKGINTLCEYASHKNVICLLETHGDIVSLETLIPIIDRIKYDNFGIIWDIGHTYKIYGEDISDFLNKMWPYIKHVHIKDLTLIDDKLELCMIGDGVIPIPEIIKELKIRNFKGYVSLEWEKRWHPNLEDPSVVIPFYAKYMREYL